MFSVRYLNRQLKRIVEDAAVVMPEGVSFFGTTYFIGNVNSQLDAGVNPPEFTYNPGDAAPCRLRSRPRRRHSGRRRAAPRSGAPASRRSAPTASLRAASGADGVPDGFPDVSHKYEAVEIELNKRFSHGWQLLANWRIAKVEGNFEGHFRNDNGQTDPAISSLFDFTEGELGLLGDQFATGPLNTDRKHVGNLYGSYSFGGGNSLNIGGGHAHGDGRAPQPVLRPPRLPERGRGSRGRPRSPRPQRHLHPGRLPRRLPVPLRAAGRS